MKSVNKCLYCEKLYTTKQNTIVHMKKCSSKTLFEENKKLKEELEQIKVELTKKNELLNFFKLAKDTNQINTTNNTQNNITINTNQPLKDIISSLQPINFEEMKKQFENKLSNKYIDKGIEGIAHFISEIPCQNKFITTDYSRKIVTYKNDNQIVVDPKANILLNTAIKQNADTIIDRAEDRYKYWNQQIKDAREDDIEPDKTDIKNRNRTKNLKTIASKAKNDVSIDIEDAANVIILKGMENKIVVNAIE
jgi:hypothetical protein